MTWFKVDDQFHSSRKLKAIPRRDRLAAAGLWAIAGSWSAQELTEGFVPAYMLDEFGASPRLARALVEARAGSAHGLWVECPGGWKFHDWLDRNPTRSQVESEREMARDRQKRARERARSRRDTTVSHAVSHAPVTPESHRESRSPRPDPTRPDPTVPPTEVHKTTNLADARLVVAPAEAGDKPSQQRRRKLPTDWQLTDTLRDYATSRGVNPDSEAEAFEDHHRAKGSTMLDWDAAWRTWVRNAVKFGTARRDDRSAAQRERDRQRALWADQAAQEQTRQEHARQLLEIEAS